MDAAVMSVLARIGRAALSRDVLWCLDHWDELDSAEQGIVRADLERLARLLGEGLKEENPGNPRMAGFPGLGTAAGPGPGPG